MPRGSGSLGTESPDTALKEPSSALNSVSPCCSIRLICIGEILQQWRKRDVAQVPLPGQEYKRLSTGGSGRATPGVVEGGLVFVL